MSKATSYTGAIGLLKDESSDHRMTIHDSERRNSSLLDIELSSFEWLFSLRGGYREATAPA